MAARVPPLENVDETNVMTNLTKTNTEDLLAELEDIRQKRRDAKKKQLYSSKLDPYHHTLVRRANNGESLADLKAWLEGKGVEAARTTIWLNLQQANPSRLDPYQRELAILSDRGASVAELKAWLTTKSMSASQHAILIAVRRWAWDQEEPHFLSPHWKPARTSARSGQHASKNGTTPSSDRNQ